MPWAVALGVVSAAAATAQGEASRSAMGEQRRQSRREWSPPVMPKPAPVQTHCEPCGAPLDGPVCSYCTTAAKAWRHQRPPALEADVADVVVRLADRESPATRAAYAAASVMRQADPVFVEHMKREGPGKLDRTFVGATERNLEGDDLAQRFAQDAVWHAAGVYTPTFGPGVDVVTGGGSGGE